MERYIHGGDLYRNRVRLDFSVNLNPLGTPESVREAVRKSAGRIQEYPDADYKRLREAMGKFLGADSDSVICGNGASELITAVVTAVRPETVLLGAPDYYGYERSARSSGCKISFIMLWESEAELESESDRRALELCKLKRGLNDSPADSKKTLVMLSNPNNPTGRFFNKAEITEVIETACRRGFYFLLDESFLPFVEGGEKESLVSLIGNFSGLFILRSMTKLFSMPGVRLGGLVTATGELRDRVSAVLPEWNVSVPAEEAGVAAMADRDYVNHTQADTARERRILKEGLEKAGLKVFGGAANYLLVKSDAPLYSLLLEEEILIRDCRNFRGLGEGYYRIAVRTEGENRELLETLKRVL